MALWENATDIAPQWGQSLVKITDTISVESTEEEWPCAYACNVA